AAGARVRALAEAGPARSGWDRIGSCASDPDAVARHLDAILALPMIDVAAIRKAAIPVALDSVRGAGGPVMAELFRRLGTPMTGIHLEADGCFPHEPEP